jgi:hypothetical protein
MRSIQLLRLSALTAALFVAGAAVGQAPGPKQGPPPELVRPAPISVDDIVERIMAFDTNKDGKVTKEELPERMQHLIALGDTNKDGALDRDEIRKLATTLVTAAGGLGGSGELRTLNFRQERLVGPGPGGIARGAIGGPGPGGIEGVVDDLKLAAKKKDLAMAAVKAHQENVAKLLDQARAELLQKMKGILSEEELNDFKAALDRPRGGVTIINVGPPDGPRPGDAQRRIDQLQKELDDLRRDLRR